MRLVFYILAAISVVGAIAIPSGDPQFLGRAIILEASFIALTVLTFRGFRRTLYACVPIAIIVIVGNSLAPPHVEIMTTFSKPFNAVVLIIGGYVLQIALIVTTLVEFGQSRLSRITRKTN